MNLLQQFYTKSPSKMSENISEDKSDMEYAVKSYLSIPGASI